MDIVILYNIILLYFLEIYFDILCIVIYHLHAITDTQMKGTQMSGMPSPCLAL
jgi:hypothetical protein